MAYIADTTCSGLGCLGKTDCGCGCSNSGLGLFDSGLNFDQWGFAEWAAVAVGAYLAISIFGDALTAGRATARGYSKVKRGVKRGVSGVKRAAGKRSYSAATKQWGPGGIQP